MSSGSSMLSGLASGIGSLYSAAASGATAATYKQMAQLSQLKTAIAERQLNRQIYSVLGGERAAAAANGMKQSGSAEDILRSSAQEGALSKGIVTAQGQIEYAGYMGQYKAAKAAQSGSFLSGALSIAGSLLSDGAVKCDLRLITRRPDGLGIYRFRYLGQPTVYEGVLAEEVERVYPGAVAVSASGFRMVDYGAIGAEMKVVGGFDAAD
jgi:hypothetical protein